MTTAEFDADKGGLSGTYLKPGDPEKVDSIITAFNMTAYSNTLIPQVSLSCTRLHVTHNAPPD